MGYHHIKYDVAEEIATITLNRPEARNALSTEMREDISNALEDIKERAGEDVKAVILTGACSHSVREPLVSRLCVNAAGIGQEVVRGQWPLSASCA